MSRHAWSIQLYTVPGFRITVISAQRESFVSTHSDLKEHLPKISTENGIVSITRNRRLPIPVDLDCHLTIDSWDTGLARNCCGLIRGHYEGWHVQFSANSSVLTTLRNCFKLFKISIRRKMIYLLKVFMMCCTLILGYHAADASTHSCRTKLNRKLIVSATKVRQYLITTCERKLKNYGNLASTH